MSTAAPQSPKTDPDEALRLLEEAWSYYTPEDAPKAQEEETQDLFQYASAA